MTALPVVLVIESQPYWSAEFGRQLAGIAEVQSCHHGGDVAEKLAGSPAVILLDLAMETAALPHGIARLCSTAASVIAILPAGSDAAEWWLRELGVSAVYREDHSRDEVLETARRRLRASRHP